MERIDFSHERDLTIDTLCRRVESYYPEANFDFLKKAYHFALVHHKGQHRSSGEDYIIHPLNVASTLAKMKMDMDTIVSGMLHDVIEDSEVSEQEIEKEFGSTVCQIVIGLTKISKINFKTKEEDQAENLRKMVVAMAKDIRVIIVKLADRMHNMRTLQYVSIEKQKAKAQETLDIYVPLASRLGINSVKAELEDLCLRFLKPKEYYALAEKIAMKKSDRDLYIKEVTGIINEKLQEYALEAQIKGRSKHFYSIYKKMQVRGMDFEHIQDILAFRIIVSNITECYKCLGVIHSAFTPIPGRFKDYIAIPKKNNYQSLHTCVIGPKAERIEIQIRTNEMHEVAETGVAAHWKYKEGKGQKDQNSKLSWVQELLDFNDDVKNNSEFMDAVKNDLPFGGVFVFTPNGDVKELQYGSTPLDFAYAVHTEIGGHCTGAKVNGKMVPLKYRLKSGDLVEVMTSKTQFPSKDWLKFVRSSKAKSKIKQYFLRLEKEKQAETNQTILKNPIKQNTKVEPSSSNASMKEVQIVHHANQQDNSIIVDDMENFLVRMAKCCNPIPGDPIIGYITRGRGITVHTQQCSKKNLRKNFKSSDDKEELDQRLIPVTWNEKFSFNHPVNIKVISHDRPGVLANITKELHALNVNIRSAMAKSLPEQKGSFIFEIEVRDFRELIKIIQIIERMEEIIHVERL